MVSGNQKSPTNRQLKKRANKRRNYFETTLCTGMAKDGHGDEFRFFEKLVKLLQPGMISFSYIKSFPSAVHENLFHT